MKLYKKVILPKGFKANAVACGIKRSGKLDLALFYSQVPAKASCQFTTNKIKAAPILVDKKHLKLNKEFHAIIANSGNANCFTGSSGIRDAEETAAELAKLLAVRKGSILVASTGIIAKKLPVHKIKTALEQLLEGLSGDGINKAKKAIMTTDTFTKEATAVFDVGSKKVTLCGVAKGAGMIAPNMATMLTFIFTDARISQRALDVALKNAVKKSFNCITVDGCMSTNDSVMMLANCAAANPLIDRNSDLALFSKALTGICMELAKLIIKDAEGATKFIRIKVKDAKNFQEAQKVALSIANSSLFKTAVYGSNPNFGRVVAAAGASGVGIKEKDLKVQMGSLKRKEINVEVSINRGNAAAVIYTSDLTPAYIKINAAYN